ncbi:PREDICTED: uncharacterized protein LOC109231716 [Nicotiana attenuata]|uniref:uncharacterized protein LOC109231716 n=1 Tax=Nicotiana attenuata TaxID=49451 RepID=UPI000905A181|nr:PREDICTED: uncharacterized protein LOC109231716 [Nicotiana attenuata]
MVRHLARTGSDHRPLLVKSYNSQHNGIKYFKFLDFWSDQPDFLQLVEEVWHTQITGNPMWKLQQKLKLLSRKLTHWSKEVIGNVFDQVNIWEAKMQELEELDLLNNNAPSREELNKGHVEYIRWMGMQDTLLKQKAKSRWFEDGDSNTTYFHSVIRDRRRKLQLHRIKNHRDNWIQGEDNIAKAAVHHFQHLFNLYHDFRDQDILNYIPSCIIEEDNANLSAIPEYEEIKEHVFSMSSSSSAGPDGYNGTFYHKCWNIIKDDVQDFVQDFFNGRRLTKFYSHTCLVLIPKVESPTIFSDLGPISLSNFSCKIVSKILSSRLNPLLNKIISENQSGFIKGRTITKNVLLAQEIVQNIKQVNTGGNIIMKLDMAKAYDRMSWIFLMAVMRKFGFNEEWIDLIFRLLMMSAYTDDIVIFIGGDNKTIKLIKKVIRRYENASGQKLMMQKASSSLPLTPQLAGLTGSEMLQRLNAWQGKMLSYGGKLILIKHVLQSLPIYILCALNPPKSVPKLMEKHFANFFWGTSEGKNNYHWSARKNLCLPKEEGGVGIRRMEDITEPLNIKRWWRFRTQPSLWTTFLRNKYCKRAHVVAKIPISSDSHAWKSMMKIKKKVEPNIIWKIQAGNSSFWWDNWTGYGALAMVVQDQRKSAKVQAKHYICNGTWDTIKLNDTLPAHIIDTISKNTVGKATLMISQFGISLKMIETMHHVFNGSDAAQFIWNEIGKPLGMKHQLEPIIGTFKRWFNHNAMKYQGVWIIKQAIAKVIPGIDSKVQWPSYCDKIEKLKPVQTWKQVRWQTPLADTIKVNTDGSFIKETGTTGIGGIVRNSNGDLIMAFSVNVQSNSNNMTEALAAEFGVKWCSHHGFTNFVLELGSLIVENMLTKKEANNLKIKQIVDNIINSINDANVCVQHCLREGNQVADCLAKLVATSNQAKIFQNFQQLPNKAKSVFLLDKWQLPTIRTKCEKSNFFVS